MRYAENKEQSAEFLRLALPLMARQSAALHPVSYALWYEHVAGINPPLSRVLEARLTANQPLSEEEVYDLHTRYIVARDVEVLERLQHKLRVLLEDAAHATAEAAADTGRFEVTLSESHSRLSGAQGLEDVSSLLSELLLETTRMRSATHTVAEKLESRAHEVGVLTQQLEQAQTEAMLDPLTGLKNRRGFERAVQDLVASGKDFQGAALLVADVDHFKQVNDTHGHLLGDKVLRAIGRILLSNIKGRDVAARLGGEEFSVLLPETTLEGAEALARQIRTAVAAGRFRKVDGTEIPGAVTLSLGVAVGRAGDSLESLLARADQALYEAKRGGRNRVCVDANRG